MSGKDMRGFQNLFEAYANGMSGDVMRYALRRAPLNLPTPDPNLVSRLFKYCEGLFEQEAVLLQIPSPCVVIGDIHGQILDLFRILNVLGLPSAKRRYLFLGDLIDRGEFSIECLVCAFLLKALWPDLVYIIRGNHEFGFLCSQCGFMTQIVSFFGDASLFQDAVSAFRYLPLAARIDESILCVHGGIGPSVTHIATIGAIGRPIVFFGDDLFDSLVWIDPSDYIENIEISPTRGAG
jgi:protein phosphatase